MDDDERRPTMLRLPLALRLNPARPIRDQIREAAVLGARGVAVDATGDLSPDRLSATGRRELRHLLRSVELSLVALTLPTRRPFDTTDQLDDRLRRAERAFTMGFELGTTLVLARVGPLPPDSDADRRAVWTSSVRDLGLRADHRGVRLALETGTEPGDALRPVLDALDSPGLAASIDPGALLSQGLDPAATVRELAPWVAHAYATEPAAVAARPGLVPRSLDWEEYLGALEEIGYRGSLTVWPDPTRGAAAAEFTALSARFQRL